MAAIMARNRRIGFATRTIQQKPQKGAQGELIYGFHSVLAALRNPERKKQRLWVTREASKSLATEGFSESKNGGLDWCTVSHQEIDAIFKCGVVHQGLCLDCTPLSMLSLEEACAPDDGRAPVLLLDQVSDPHNVGAILRSAAAFGVRAVILQERHSPAATGTLAKAASGALEITPLVRVTNLARAMHQLKNMGYWLTGLDAEAEAPIGKESWRYPVALVLGAEGRGLRRLTREKCDSLTAIRLDDNMQSLNVSNAAAVALYVIQNYK